MCLYSDFYFQLISSLYIIFKRKFKIYLRMSNFEGHFKKSPGGPRTSLDPFNTFTIFSAHLYHLTLHVYPGETLHHAFKSCKYVLLVSPGMIQKG